MDRRVSGARTYCCGRLRHWKDAPSELSEVLGAGCGLCRRSGGDGCPGHAFSRPKRVYTEVYRNLRWREGSYLRDTRALLERGLHLGWLRDHIYFKHLQSAAGDAEWAWISGQNDAIRPGSSDDEHRSLPALYDYTTAANIYCYLLSSLGWLCQSQIIGLKGLLLLFDESESLFLARGQLARDRSANFIEALLSTANNEPALLGPPYETDLDYSGHSTTVPFLYKPTSGLKLLLAFTNLFDLWVSPALRQLPFMNLQPLTTKHLVTMLGQLKLVYDEAYDIMPGDIDVETAKVLLSETEFENTRHMVKGFVEALDIARLGTF